MDVKITKKPETSEAVLDITVSVEEFKPYLERAAKNLAKEHPLKGFRPGKITVTLAMEHYGTERVLNTALDRAVPHYFVQAVLDNDIDAINRPNIAISKISLEEGLVFTATVAVLPEVKLGEITNIQVEKRDATVKDEDIDRELTFLAKSRATPLEVARPAQKGDTVTVDFKISMNGQPLEGGESQNHPVNLGEGHFIPEFEQKLEGIQSGDVREFNMKFPDDYAREEFKGKEAQAWVQAHSVQQRILPELNDEFAKKLGNFQSMEHLKQELRTNMQIDKDQHEVERYQGELAEKLAENATFGPIPEILIERETDHRLEEFSNMLAYQGKTVDEYLNQTKKTVDDMRAELKPSAERGVKVGLALRKLGDEQQIAVDEKEVEEKVQEYLSRFASTKQARSEVDPDELRESFASTIRNQKILQRLAELVEKK